MDVSSQSNDDFQIKTEEMEFKLEDLHHSINIKEETPTRETPPDEECELTSDELLMLIHTDDKSFKCKICDYKAASKTTLIIHLRTHTGEKPYQCEYCEYKCANKGVLNRHVKIHTGDKPFKCKFCDYKCSRNGNLNRHVRIHTGEKPYLCEICDSKFAGKGNLNRHLKTHSISCQSNGYVQSKPDEVEVKLEDLHHSIDVKEESSILESLLKTSSDDKPFQCKFCELKYAREELLIIHLETHACEKPFICAICENKFSTKRSLIYHLKIHSADKLLSLLRDKGYLPGHSKAHTEETGLRTPAGDKLFWCGICEYKCKNKGVLNRHVKIHTGDKPFRCKFCDYKCSRNGNLKTHVRSHTGERPYICEICNFKFSAKGNLTKHLKTHADEK